MSVFPLVLFDIRNGEIIISPHRRYRTVITFGNGIIFGEILDRDRGNAVVVDLEDHRLLQLLARLVARGMGEGVFSTPIGTNRVGVRHQEALQSFGCYGLDDKGRETVPIVLVAYNKCQAITYHSPRNPVRTRGATPEEAMLGATAVFIAHSLAA